MLVNLVTEVITIFLRVHVDPLSIAEASMMQKEVELTITAYQTDQIIDIFTKTSKFETL